MEAANTLSELALSEKDFNRLGCFISKETGIKLPLSKKLMIESRLKKRVRALDFASFSEYCDHVFSDSGLSSELYNMIDEVTTNKTDFFREPAHFSFLFDLVSKNPPNEIYKIWSSACSSGEEAFTIAMIMEELRCVQPCLQYEISATDISNKVLEKGRLGIYKEESISPVLPEYKSRYIMRSRDKGKKTVRMKPQLRSRITFTRYNLLNGPLFSIRDFDVIFCRNVLIYFTHEDQQTVLSRLYSHLRPGGYLFLGHSESIINMKLKFVQEAPTIYRKPENSI